MKKFLVITSIIVIVLFLVDKFILAEKGVIGQIEQVDKYKAIKDPDKLSIGLKIDNRAPDFKVKTMTGKETSLADYKGKKIVLNFWASWCPPCKAEMPHMQRLYDKYKDEGYVILALNMTNTEKNLADVQAFVDNQQLTFPILLDENGEVSAMYEILAYPTSYFIDSNGVIRSKVTGALDEEYLYKEMIRLP